jgi:hypothetical protein
VKHCFVSVLAAACGLWACAALAASPTYVGRWADSPDSCRVGEVVTLTAREMHLLENGLCRFHKTVRRAGHWHTTMTCSGEGSTDTVSADLMVKGDTLSIIYGKPHNTTAKFKRCDRSGTASTEPEKAAATATDQQIPETPRQPADMKAYRAKAMAFLMQDMVDKNPNISLDLVDLNGDGIPEALAVIESPSDCGTRGCTAYALDLSGPTARSIGDFTAQSLKPLPTKTGAWRDVALSGVKMSFHAGGYKSAR